MARGGRGHGNKARRVVEFSNKSSWDERKRQGPGGESKKKFKSLNTRQRGYGNAYAPMPRLQRGGGPRGGVQGRTATSSRRIFPARPDALIVYIDGSCLDNGGSQARGGFGGYYGPDDSRNFSLSLHPMERQTNNRGELRSAIWVLHQHNEEGSLQPINIHTDSEYLVNGITRWIDHWRETDFDGIANRDLWEELDTLVTERNRNFSHDAVSFTFVRGHSGNQGNDMADYYARQGARSH